MREEKPYHTPRGECTSNCRREGCPEEPEEDWEVQFDKMFPKNWADKCVTRIEIIDFIRQWKARWEKELLDRHQHNFIPYRHIEAWGSNVPPPSLECDICHTIFSVIDNGTIIPIKTLTYEDKG